MLSVITDAQAHGELRSDLDAIVREGARRMLAAALEAEVDDYLTAHAAERDEGGRRLVVRNGHARERQVTTAAGAVAVRAPRVDDRRVDPATGQRVRFRSVVLPPWCRKSPKVAEVLPLLYLHGLSTGDFVPALEAFFGSGAGLSAAVITRLVAAWQADYEAFCRRDLADRDYVYVWADGVHFKVRLEQARLCCLVIVGVRADGTKELVAVCDGERESTDSWAELLRDLRRRGMRAPVVAVGDGRWGCGRRCATSSPRPATSATGSTRSPTCWVACPPRCRRGRARRWLRSGMRLTGRAPSRRSRRSRATTASSGPRRWPRSSMTPRSCCASSTSRRALGASEDQQPDRVDLSMVRLRTRVTKGPGSKAAGLAMAFKLLEAAQDRWRAVNGPHLVAPVRAGARFDKGVMVERPDEAQEVAA
jgi:putative transposase